MELLERYLHAVGEHLPARGRADTLAELRANLESEIEGREKELGRPLTEAEVAQVLETHGMPVMVAARYGPQHFLIGPGLFPFYWYTLKRSFPLVLGAFWFAWKRRFQVHTRITKVLLPIWIYVSVTGVVVYWMLYRLR